MDQSQLSAMAYEASYVKVASSYSELSSIVSWCTATISTGNNKCPKQIHGRISVKRRRNHFVISHSVQRHQNDYSYFFKE